jgi:uncharacterized protein
VCDDPDVAGDTADPEVIGDRPTVTVVGVAVVRGAPDEATIRLDVRALEPSAAVAMRDVTRRAQALAAVLDELNVARSDWTTTGVNVHEEFDHSARGTRSRGHLGTVETAIRATDPDLIGRLILRAIDEAGVSVDGPHWQVSAGHPIRVDAAKLAAVNARRRAEAYAAGVGARLGRLLELSEPRTDRPMIRRAGGLMPMAVAAAAGEGVPIELGEHEVSATIAATFALEP